MTKQHLKLAFLCLGAAAFWVFIWIDVSRYIGIWPAIIIGLVPVYFLVYRLAKHSIDSCPSPESLYVVEITQSEIINKHPDGRVERIGIEGLKEIKIVTNDTGPWGADFWWCFLGKDGVVCNFPQGATGESAVADWVIGLNGFDNEAFGKAIRSTSNAEFVCWHTS